MAHREACELYIEQEIKEGLAAGKKPYSIGKELSSWVEKLFETNIPADTLRKRAERIAGQMSTTNTSMENPSEIPDNQTPEVKHGGKRAGAGAPQKYEFTQALQIATFVISHLERIMADDPNRRVALDKVSKWIIKNL